MLKRVIAHPAVKKAVLVLLVTVLTVVFNIEPGALSAALSAL